MTLTEIYRLVKAEAPVLLQSQAIITYLEANPDISQHKLARMVGLSQTKVHMLVGLAQLTPEVKQCMQTNGIRYAIQKLYNVSRLAPELQMSAFQELKPARKMKITYSVRS